MRAMISGLDSVYDRNAAYLVIPNVFTIAIGCRNLTGHHQPIDRRVDRHQWKLAITA